MATSSARRWAAFARTGDPTTPALRWPRYEPATDVLVVLVTSPSEATHVKVASCDRWDAVSAR